MAEAAIPNATDLLTQLAGVKAQMSAVPASGIKNAAAAILASDGFVSAIQQLAALQDALPLTDPARAQLGNLVSIANGVRAQVKAST